MSPRCRTGVLASTSHAPAIRIAAEESFRARTGRSVEDLNAIVRTIREVDESVARADDPVWNRELARWFRCGWRRVGGSRTSATGSERLTRWPSSAAAAAATGTSSTSAAIRRRCSSTATTPAPASTVRARATAATTRASAGGIFGTIAVGAPVAKVFPGRAIEDDDASVAVAVGDEHFVVARIHPDLRRTSHQRRVIASARLVVPADGHQDLASLAEFHREVALARVGPQEVVMVDEHSVYGAPVSVRTTRIPRLHEVPLWVPFLNAVLRRRPHVSAPIGEDSDDLTPLEVGRKLRPSRVRAELRDATQSGNRTGNVLRACPRVRCGRDAQDGERKSNAERER